MTVEFRIISIGTLSRNVFWSETEAVRTPHATTTLVTSGDQKILVDPSLPGPVLNARLYERAGIRNADVTAVFLTTFRPVHRAALAAFDQAKWYLHGREKEHAKKLLDQLRRRSRPEPNIEDDARRIIEEELELLNRCQSAPEKLADQVELFPSPGVSPGSSGLLLTPPVGAVVIAGDAVINTEYLEHGRVWDDSFDLKQAQESLRDILEVADVIVPGHDNLIPLMGKLL